MIEELIYTSAAQGLKSGSKGFCTVASTAGMGANLVSLLESLSGYRHLADPGSPGAERNPVVHNHLKLRLGGRSLQVLSRVADAGLDYSGRSNKIAHHVVLSAVKLPICGPAAVQVQAGFHEVGWTDEPHLIDRPRAIPSPETPPEVCRYWQEVTEDAGWGGVLAERLLRGRDDEQWIIYPLGVDPLRLLEETLALLPPDLRWQTTYTTFYTKLPPGIDCRVRWVVDGTPEAQQLRKRYQLQALDLCERMPAPLEGALVTAARTGILAEVRKTAPSKDSVPQESVVVLADEDSYEVDLADVVAAAPPPLPGRPMLALSRGDKSTEHKNAWVLAGALATLLFLVVGSLAYFGYKSEWFSSFVASKNEQQSETPSQEQEEKDGVNKNEEKQTESEGPIENQPAPSSQGGDAKNLSKDAFAFAESPQDNPTAPLQEKNSEDGQQNIIPQNNASGTSVNQEPTGLVDSSKEKEIAKLESPFPKGIVVLDKVIPGGKTSIPVSLDDVHRLAVHFFYPMSKDDKDLPYHVKQEKSEWTIFPSDPGRPKNPERYDGQELLTIASDGENLEFKFDKRLGKPKYKKLFDYWLVNLVLNSENPSEPFLSDVRFSKLQREDPLKIENPPLKSMELINRLNGWESKWQLVDVSRSWTYFLRYNDQEVSVNFYFDKNKGLYLYSKTLTVSSSRFFKIKLQVDMEFRSEHVLNATLAWEITPINIPRINTSDAVRDGKSVKDLFRLTRVWKQFKKDFEDLPLSGVPWEQLSKELAKADGKVAPYDIGKAKLSEVKQRFSQVGDMTGIPDAFDPGTELQFLKNIHTDLELGIKLESYPAKTKKQLVLISTKKNDSSSEGQK